MPKGYTYILECADGSYYTGSTKDLDLRIEQHNIGAGAKYTARRLPAKLLYYEEYQRIDDAFYREKQLQGWSRKKKEALITGRIHVLKALSICRNESKSPVAWASAPLSHQPLAAATSYCRLGEQRSS